MRCDDVRMALSAALDGEPESLDALRHVKLCAACAAYARETAALDRDLHLAVGSPEPLPARFMERLMARIPEARPAPAPPVGAPDRVAGLAGLGLLAAGLIEGLGLAGVPIPSPVALAGELATAAAGALGTWAELGSAALAALPASGPGPTPMVALAALAVAALLHGLAVRGLRPGEA